MNTSRLFYLRDTVIKDELLRIFESKFKISEDQLTAIRNDVEQAYEAGNAEWANKTLPDVLGKRAANDFLTNVSEELRLRPAAG
ncbi:MULTISPECIES: hypothetical protein [Bradyrhizobium]|uniref:hypothetical protein n=1 Tax=Bradyrhizobium pachyrhizi TaxID=280333 RepID=UPI00041EAE06